MIKLTRLKEMIAEKGQTYKKCAAVIHVSPQTFTKKNAWFVNVWH